jgi:hypothetical protein
MEFAIQINSYKGDGSPLETEYRFGYIEIKGDEGSFKLKDSTKDFVYFKLQEFRIHDCVMSLKGTNKSGYGKLDLCFTGNDSHIWKLAEEQIEVDRLTKIYTETPKHFREQYGYIDDISEIRSIARNNINQMKN